MRVLFFLLAPFMAQCQLDTVITYKTKVVDNIVIKADSTTLSWNADTIRYSSNFEIKFSKAKNNIAIDGYGIYKITKHELHGVIADFDIWPGYHYFELSNGSKLTLVEGSVIWDWPVINKKTKTIIFEID